jgi:hypothetical protein
MEAVMILLGIVGASAILVVFCWFDRVLSRDLSDFGADQKLHSLSGSDN